MNYVKSCLIITMLLGIGYSQDCDPDAIVGWNCDCNEDTWQEYYPNMEGCYLYGAYLVGANLTETNLGWADLSGANLEGANISWADLTNANLWWANLIGADLSGANLFQANLSGANLCNLAGSPSFDVCEESVTDNNGDGYDDVSYDAGAESGDLNLDGGNDILDIVLLVNNILNP